MIPRWAYYFIKGRTLPLLGNQHYQIAPCNSYRTADGRYLMLIVPTEKHWQNYCQSLERADLFADARFQTNANRLKNMDQLNEILDKIFQSKTQQEWINRLTNKGVMVAPVYNLEQVFQDPQIRHDQMVIELDHPVAGKIKILRTLLNLSQTPPQIKRPPPILGQHTEEILSAMGFSQEEIQELKNKGAVK